MNKKLSLHIALVHACTFTAASSFAYLPVKQNSHYRWYSDVALTWMKPSNMYYGETLAGPGSPVVLIKPSYTTGVSALLGYLLTERNDLSANYTYNKFSDSGASVSDATHPSGKDAVQFNNHEKTNYSVAYDALTVSLGHYIKTPRWNTHLYGGLDYTYIQQNATQMATATNIHHTLRSQDKTTFNGIGPQFGLETGLRLNRQFKLVGGVNLGFLASNISILDTGKFSGALKNQSNIGLSYERIVRQDTHIALELGYKSVQVQNITDGGEGGCAFAMSGPYLGLGVTY